MIVKKLKRISRICQIMNDLKIITIRDLHKKIDCVEYPIGRSSIEKDLFFMKMELDIEYESIRNKGIRFTEKVDLLERVKECII